jgi:serralysin
MAIINGTSLNDVLIGTISNDTITGFAGNDTLIGGGGNDTLLGGAGNDVLNGEVGTDTASYSDATAGVTVNLNLTSAQNTVGAGIDTLISIEGLIGANFNDTLIGRHTWADTLTGGGGSDRLTGSIDGRYADFFNYNAVSDSLPGVLNRDVITDFNGRGALQSDWIDLRAIDANSLLSGDQAFTWIGGAAFSAAGQLRFSGGILSGSTDADAAAEFEIELAGNAGLTVGGSGTDILL